MYSLTEPVRSIPRIHVRRSCCATSRLLGARCNQLQFHVDIWDTIARWTPGSSFTCGVDSESFLTAGIGIDDIEHIKDCLKRVVKLLNSFNLDLRFVYVDISDVCEETFTLVYKNRPRTHATSFFPGRPLGKRKIKLSKSCFLPDYRNSIFNILCHEFAHTLGMRHWNAAWREVSDPSVQFPPGSIDQHSIMGEYNHPEDLYFHQHDIKWLRRFYLMENGSTIQHYTIKDYLP